MKSECKGKNKNFYCNCFMCFFVDKFNILRNKMEFRHGLVALCICDIDIIGGVSLLCESNCFCAGLPKFFYYILCQITRSYVVGM